MTRVLRPPKRVAVEVSRADLPVRVKLGDHYEPVNIIEQWRVAERWWQDPIDRSYVKVMGESWIVVLYHDHITGDWFLERIVD